MANQEQLTILKRSVGEWNWWRLGNPDVTIDLSGVDLTGAYLSRVNLEGANLSGADLKGADFWRADLTRANLEGVYLIEANLKGVNLKGAKLTDTVLDPKRWQEALALVWNQSCPERRANMIKALRDGECIHRAWQEGTKMCPEGYLLGREGKTDDFTNAWDTYALPAKAILSALPAPDKEMTVAS